MPRGGTPVPLRGRARPQTIAVWGNYHGANLGDELVVETIIGAIQKRQPRTRIVAISLAPRDTRNRHGVPAFPIKPGLAAARNSATTAEDPAGTRGAARRLALRVPGARRIRLGARAAAQAVREVPFDLRSRRILRDIDVIVVAGSGQLLDSWWGRMDHPLTAYRWAILSRRAGTKLLVLSVGAGPIRTRLGAAFIRGAIKRAAFISVRDTDSARVLQGIGVARPLPVRPDMAFGFPLPEPAAPPASDVTPRVGVNAMPYGDPRYWPRVEPGRYEEYLDKMATFVSHLLGGGYEVVLFSSQTFADRLVADDVMALLGGRGLGNHPRLSSQFDSIEGVDDLVKTVVSCDYVVAGRFHCVLLPLAAGIPTIGLVYHAKTRDVLTQMGRPEHRLDIDTFEPDVLYEALQRLHATDSADQRAELRQRAAELRAVVEKQFDELFTTETP